MLQDARDLAGNDYVSIVVGDPTFGTRQHWQWGGGPWRRLVASICKIVRRRCRKGEKWGFFKVNESYTSKQYVLRKISFTFSLTLIYNIIARCPICRFEGDFTTHRGIEDWKMKHMENPLGNKRCRSKVDGTVQRVRVRGLSRCDHCHVQWSRDFSASINIGWIFVHALNTGTSDRPRYLCSW